MSCDCCVALPRGAVVCLQFGIMVFPDHTHYFDQTNHQTFSHSVGISYGSDHKILPQPLKLRKVCARCALKGLLVSKCPFF